MSSTQRSAQSVKEAMSSPLRASAWTVMTSPTVSVRNAPWARMESQFANSAWTALGWREVSASNALSPNSAKRAIKTLALSAQMMQGWSTVCALHALPLSTIANSARLKPNAKCATIMWQSLSTENVQGVDRKIIGTRTQRQVSASVTTLLT